MIFGIAQTGVQASTIGPSFMPEGSTRSRLRNRQHEGKHSY
jgi:hypothetical protein